MKTLNRVNIPSLIAVTVALSIQSLAHAGKGREGGEPSQIDKETIRLLLTGGGLQKAMIRYLDTLKVDQISDVPTAATFARITENGALRKDVETPGIYVPEEGCSDRYDRAVPASAEVGAPGGKICFDVGKLANSYAALSVEDGMIRLAALAFHEHVHHFQTLLDPEEKNESEGYRLAAYAQLTAKVEQVPMLKWERPKSASFWNSDFKLTGSEITAGADSCPSHFSIREHHWVYDLTSGASGMELVINGQYFIPGREDGGLADDNPEKREVVQSYTKTEWQGDALKYHYTTWSVQGDCYPFWGCPTPRLRQNRTEWFKKVDEKTLQYSKTLLGGHGSLTNCRYERE